MSGKSGGFLGESLTRCDDLDSFFRRSGSDSLGFFDGGGGEGGRRRAAAALLLLEFVLGASLFTIAVSFGAGQVSLDAGRSFLSLLLNLSFSLSLCFWGGFSDFSAFSDRRGVSAVSEGGLLSGVLMSGSGTLGVVGTGGGGSGGGGGFGSRGGFSRSRALSLDVSLWRSLSLELLLCSLPEDEDWLLWQLLWLLLGFDLDCWLLLESFVLAGFSDVACSFLTGAAKRSGGG